MTDKLDRKFQSPLARARGLGSAHDGAHHWLLERLSSVALIPLTFWFVWSMVNLYGASYVDFTGWMYNPVNATLLILTIVVGFYHAAAGLQVIIEDYVATNATKLLLIYAQKAVFFTLGLACIVSIFKVVL
jgi:succinate dehydrogenase / fumarate reductase, membrane anchor subunit